MTWREDLCPHAGCTHPACPEQQRLVEEVERLRSLLASYEALEAA